MAEIQDNKTDIDYKAAFEKERALRIELADEVTDLKMQNMLLQEKVDKVKNSKVFKILNPFRKCIHHLRFQIGRIKKCG